MGPRADVLLQLWSCPCAFLMLLSPHFAPSCKSQMLAFPLEHPCGCISFWSFHGGLDRESLWPKSWDPCGPGTQPLRVRGHDGEDHGECGISLRISL